MHRDTTMTTTVEKHPNLTLSVLDQSPVADGGSVGQALRNSVDLAKLADSLGYHRYWLAEHHSTPALACNSPEALIGPVAMATKQIRVGSGGIMLPHYSPLKVAETFAMLAEMFPGRIDLGLGRAPGSDGGTAFALQRDRRQRSPDDFPEQLTELLGYFHGRIPGDLPLRTILPGRREFPEPYLLGSSPASGQWAANFGLPYVFADFISPTGAPIADFYRKHFQPGEYGQEPHTTVAAWVIAADTEDAAWRLASSFIMMFTLMHQGQLIAVPSPETALKFLKDRGISLTATPPGRRAIVGAPEQVKAGIEALAAEYQADEVMLVNILHDHEARKHSYELVAEAFQINCVESHA
jgi:luciferase family oxidoreductase group 1